MQVGDRVKLHRRGVSVFRIVAIDGDNATVLAEGDAPGTYEFPTSLAGLVAVADVDTSS